MNTDYDKLLSDLAHPATLKDIKKAIADIPDEHLAKYQVFNFIWGDEKGTCSWKRKETPKQYWKRLRNLTQEK
jgi:hypothetical protein